MAVLFSFFGFLVLYKYIWLNVADMQGLWNAPEQLRELAECMCVYILHSVDSQQRVS